MRREGKREGEVGRRQTLAEIVAGAVGTGVAHADDGVHVAAVAEVAVVHGPGCGAVAEVVHRKVRGQEGNDNQKEEGFKKRNRKHYAGF